MTPPARCDDIRREILAAGPLGDAPRAHLAECRACRLFAARLAIVDDGLEADAAAASLPPRLRARILAAAFPSSQSSQSSRAATTRRGRWTDLALRAAAVAAVLIGAIAVLPGSALAAEVSIGDLFTLRGAMSQPVDAPLLPRALSLSAEAAPVHLDADAATLPLALGALCLIASGIALRSRR
jgi:hypothetical protein